MRIIGGVHSGRTLVAPSGQSTRPTSDRIREAIFNRLVHGAFSTGGEGVSDGPLPLEGEVLDLFAGSGGLGLEALSRGAARRDFVDASAAACASVKRNLEFLQLSDRGSVHRGAADLFLKRCTARYGLVFADPPYADAGAPLDRTLALLVEKRLLLPGALVIVEHGADPSPRAAAGGQVGLQLLDQRRYGQTLVSFLSSSAPPP